MMFMGTAKSKKPYYYAGGKRVTLEPAADVVALAEARLAEKLPDLRLEVVGRSTRLPGGDLRLIPCDALPSDTLARLREAGVTQPVFRKDGANLVALPEVRVEDDDEAKLAEV